MRGRFSSVLAALAWYRQGGRGGSSNVMRAYWVTERVCGGRATDRDVTLGDAALTRRRIETILSALSPRERDLLFGNDPARLGLSNPNALYKRQHAIRRRLAPAFAAAGLIDPPDDTIHQEYAP